MKIRISSKKLARIVLENADKIGSTDWDIYTNKNGALDIRHNTHNMDGWFEVVDLYSFWGDDNTLNSSVEDLADWLESDGMPHFDPIEAYDNNDRRVTVNIEWK